MCHEIKKVDSLCPKGIGVCGEESWRSWQDYNIGDGVGILWSSSWHGGRWRKGDAERVQER